MVIVTKLSHTLVVGDTLGLWRLRVSRRDRQYDQTYYVWEHVVDDRVDRKIREEAECVVCVSQRSEE